MKLAKYTLNFKVGYPINPLQIKNVLLSEYMSILLRRYYMYIHIYECPDYISKKAVKFCYFIQFYFVANFTCPKHLTRMFGQSRMHPFGKLRNEFV